LTELALRPPDAAAEHSSTPANTIGADSASAPFAGILDVRDGRGVVRGVDCLTGLADPLVPATLIQRYGLRRGDEVTGAAGPSARGQGRHRDRIVVARVDTVNGRPPATLRAEFHQLTPLFPQERLRLETEPRILTTRVIDLLTPIGKGQRALIVSPPKAGKTMVLHAIAHAISVNHPECHLIALLIDERPEEVTDMRRTVRGEVIASTFDRAPTDHLATAELAVERAKRLVEGGRDVVILLDSITRLARAYNLAAPSGGRTMTGGIDASALQGPKRILGAARNLEQGGTLTIIASALVETGSTGDGFLFEEFKSTGNAELRLLRALADRRIFPAVDVESSGTRREELLLDPEELVAVRRLRRALHTMDGQQAGEHLLDGLRRTQSNTEFLLAARAEPRRRTPTR
jgi:transcription termination factor Rho